MKNVLRRILLGIGVVLALMVLLVVGVVLARDRIATKLITKAIAEKGFGVEFKNLHLALMPPGVEIEGLKLTNPPDFPETQALEIGRLKVSYDRSASTKEETRLPEVTFDLPKLVIVRKSDGEVNFQRFSKSSKEQKPITGAEAAPPPQPQPAPEPPAQQPKKVERKVRIDRLNVRLGTILVRTYKPGEKEPQEQKFEMNVDKHYTDVTNDKFKEIGTQLMLEILFKQQPDQLLNGLLKASGTNSDDVKQSARQLGNQLKGLLQNFKQQPPPQP